MTCRLAKPNACAQRVVQIYDRIETQLKQMLREADPNQAQRATIPEMAGLLLAFVEGRIALCAQRVSRSPVKGWESSGTC